MNIVKYQQDIDSCRFCFMCRHVCSVARVTNEEEMTPRVRALMLSMVLRDAEDYSEDIAETIYQCCLCEYCKEWCQGGWDFSSVVRAARVDLVKEGLVPEVVQNVKDSLMKFNNPYGHDGPISSELQEIISQNTTPAETLILFGSSVLYLSPEIALRVVSLLNKANVDFMVLEKEAASGYELYNLGYLEEAKEKIALLVKSLKMSGCKEVVTLSGSLHYLLTEELNNMGLELEGIRVYHVTEYLLKLISEGKIDLKEGLDKKITYHESDYLARYSKLYNAPRKLIEQIKSAKYVELRWNKGRARSIGSALLKNTYPELAAKLLKTRLDEVIETGVDILITSSGEDKSSFVNSPDKPSSLQIADIVELIDDLS